MIYTEHRPNTLLLPYIETYWSDAGAKRRGALSQDTARWLCGHHIFVGDTSPQSRLIPLLPNIVGAMTTFGEGHYSSSINMLGLRFRPAGITAFTRVPVSEFTNMDVDLSLVDSVFDEQFHTLLPEMKLTDEKIKHIDTYLLQKLKVLYCPRPQIVYAVSLIEQTYGQLSPSDVADKCCMSLRHFEREFKAAVGYSPKTFSRITKFNYTRKYVKRNRDISLFSAAIDCGYYDQTHLIKDFKALSGEVPSYFKD